MKKIFGMLLVCVMMVGFISPVFAIDGEGTGTTEVEYVVGEDSFSWSIPATLTVGHLGDMGKGIIQINNYSLSSSNKEIHIDLIGALNYDNGFNLKKTGENTKYPYLLGIERADGLMGSGIDVSVEPSSENPIPYLIANHTPVEGEQNRLEVVSGESPSVKITAYIYDENKPTTAGTYTDRLIFRARVVTVD